MLRMNQKLDPTQTGQEAEQLHKGLHKRIIGQDDAINHIVNIYQTYLTGMNRTSRPVGNFLFLGPTGTGKTRLVEATAECLVGEAGAITKIDCAEFQHSHEIAKLIGSPPGYLGHRETHPLLSQEMLNQYHSEKMKLSFVLFDEIEKASDALWNLLLGILDKATLTLGDNRRVDFSRTLIFMTSNLGAAEMNAIARPNLGFATCEVEKQLQAGQVDADITRRISSAGVEAARRRFTPEFMNRIDKIVTFKILSAVDLQKILELELQRLQQRIFSSTAVSFVFSLTEAAKGRLLSEGTDVRYGARHLNRAIDRSLVQPLSNLIATRQVCDGDWIKVDFEPISEEMTFSKQAQHIPAYALLQMRDSGSCLPPSQASTGATQLPGELSPGRRAPAGSRERNLAA